MRLLNPKITHLNSIYVVFLLLGSSVMSFVPTLLKIGNATQWKLISIVSTIGISCVFLINGVLGKRKSVVPIQRLWPLFIFWMFYLFRMYYDLLLIDRYDGDYSLFLPFSTTSYFFIYFIGLCVIPSLSILYLKLDFFYILKLTFWILFFVLILSMLYNAGVKETEFETTVRNKGSEGLSYLAYGHWAVTFSLISFFFFTTTTKAYNKFFFLGGFIFGIIVMYLAGSRSPLFALVLCVMALLLARNGLTKGLFAFAAIVTVFFLFWDAIIGYLSRYNVVFLERIMSSITEGESSGRDEVYIQAILQITRSPIFGDALLLTEGSFYGVYPHNMLLESLMTTGVIGSLFFVIWLFKTCRLAAVITKANTYHIWISILFLQYFIFGMASLAFYTNTTFWYLSFMLWNYYYNES